MQDGEVVLVLRGFPSKTTADEMASFIWRQVQHYRWVSISMESLDGKEVKLLHGWDNP